MSKIETVIKRPDDLLSVELSVCKEMIEKKAEFRDLLAQIYKVISLIHRLSGRSDKIYMLDKEIELQKDLLIKKGTYNSWPVLVMTCISGALTMGGGLTGIFSAFPGTAAGNFLGKAPFLKSFFDTSTTSPEKLAQKISGISNAMSSLGQGTGMFTKLVETRDEQKRTIVDFELEKNRRKLEDRNRSTNEENQQCRETQRSCQQAENEMHHVFSKVLEAR